MSETLKVVGFSCSPRRGGNTDVLVQRVLGVVKEAGADVVFIRVADMSIAPCDACGTCAGTAQCHIEDDMQSIYPRLLRADGIVIGSPVYMGHSVSGQAQVFMDRTYSLWHQRNLRDRVGGGVVAANRRGGISAVKVITSLFFNHDMIVAGYATGYGDAPGNIIRDERAIKDAESLGKRMYELMSLMKKKV